MHPCLLLRVLAEYDLQLCAGSTGTPASLYSCTPSEGIHAQVTSQREEGREGRGGREGEREGKRPIDHVKTPPGLAGARSHAAGCPSCEEERKRQRERERQTRLVIVLLWPQHMDALCSVLTPRKPKQGIAGDFDRSPSPGERERERYAAGSG